MEAQRFPSDFDGIIAGSPAANWTGRALSSLWVGQAVHKDEASYIPRASIHYFTTRRSRPAMRSTESATGFCKILCGASSIQPCCNARTRMDPPA